MTVDFKFAIGDKVIISEIQRPGVVNGLRLTPFGKDVLVHWWNDSKREEAWLYESEVESRAQPAPL